MTKTAYQREGERERKSIKQGLPGVQLTKNYVLLVKQTKVI